MSCLVASYIQVAAFTTTKKINILVTHFPFFLLGKENTQAPHQGKRLVHISLS